MEDDNSLPFRVSLSSDTIAKLEALANLPGSKVRKFYSERLAELYASMFPITVHLDLPRIPQFKFPTGDLQELYERGREYREPSEDKICDDLPTLIMSSIIVPEKRNAQGIIISAHAIAWAEICRHLVNDWSKAYEIPATKWEEIVAGAFDKAGYDQVILTPRSGDHGRDVIALKRGVGSIKIIGSVKAYKPTHIVGYDDVRALLGVLSGETDASKGMVITTSDFPPRILKDPFIAAFAPTRLELVNGRVLGQWLQSLL